MRNVYLELHDCDVIAKDWISKRNAREFDTKDYSSTASLNSDTEFDKRSELSAEAESAKSAEMVWCHE